MKKTYEKASVKKAATLQAIAAGKIGGSIPVIIIGPNGFGNGID